MGRTLLDKVWDAHVVAELGGGYQLLHVDRHLLHDLGGAPALRALARRGLTVRSPQLCFATPDHCVATSSGRGDDTASAGSRLIPALRSSCAESGIRLFDLGSAEQGIVHVIGPELGLTLPGLSLVCGDSHTCTHGALGALAWGIGTSEVVHALATQTVIERKPARLKVEFSGRPANRVHAKDLILHVIATHGVELGVGHAVEYAGETVRAMGMEARMTLCNLSIELGAKIGMVAPDDTTYEYLAGRPYAPGGAAWARALDHWRTLPGDADAVFDRTVSVRSAEIAPQVTWGTSPMHGGAVDQPVPDPATLADPAGAREALAYMGIAPGASLVGLPLDYVFIGSCTNSRRSDLEAAAEMVAGRRVADGVEAWVVPGSEGVKRAAEARGLDAIFRAAGFDWREPGCSRCVASNGEYVAPGKRCLSTSNRNFVGRQGPRARTHLASPVTAAASAIAGTIVDVRTWR
ncbi:MAG TPA: 3-isopropylmalate dehydratase large subunit [Pseudomonadales bacterium]